MISGRASLFRDVNGGVQRDRLPAADQGQTQRQHHVGHRRTYHTYRFVYTNIKSVLRPFTKLFLFWSDEKSINLYKTSITE